MKKIGILLSFIALSILSVNSQNTEERKVSSFDKLKVSSELKVYLTKGVEEKVKVVASGIDIKDVLTEVIGKTLEIELSRGIFLNANIEVYITYKEIRDINVGASGRVSVQEPLTGDKVILNANTNGELTADLNLRTVDVKVGQGATVRLNGKTGSIDARINTGGILAAIDLQADSIYVRVGSAGTAKVRASYLLDANVRTGGTLTYTGKPINKTISTGIGATINEVE